MHQALEQVDLALVLVERGAEDGAHVLLVEAFRHAREDPCEVAAVDDGIALDFGNDPVVTGYFSSTVDFDPGPAVREGGHAPQS